MKLGLAKAGILACILCLTINVHAWVTECGNGLVQQFSIGDIGRIGFTPVDFFRLPETDVQRQLPAGLFFRVIEGPVCSSSGVSWWHIETDSFRPSIAEAKINADGWVAETVGSIYQVEVFEIYKSNFNTTVTLDAPAPMINSLQQISYVSGAGGGNPDCRYWEQFGSPKWLQFGDTILRIQSGQLNTFADGENVLVTIYYPDGTIFSQRTGEASKVPCPYTEVGFDSLSFDIDDPTGEWIVEFVGANSTIVRHSIYLTQNTTPYIKSVCTPEGQFQLVLSGFSPGETISISLVEVTSRLGDTYLDGENTRSLATWTTNVDHQGQLLAHFPQSFVPSDLRYILVTDKNDEVWGDHDDWISGTERKVTFHNCAGKRDLDTNVQQIPVPFITAIPGTLFEPDRYTRAFYGEAGDVLDIRLERLYGEVDPVLTLIDPDGRTIAQNDDAPDTTQVNEARDSYIDSFELPVTGTYTLEAASIDGGNGDYKLSVLLASGKTAEPLQNQSLAAIRPSSRDEARTHETIWAYATFRDTQFPSLQEYSIELNVYEPLLFTFTWCADNAQRLEEILEPLTVAFSINDMMINATSILITDTSSCRIWDTVLDGWQSGDSVELELLYRLSEPIFDGVATYAVGEYSHRFLITVS